MLYSCQRWFTKRIKGMSRIQYSQRFAYLNLESLQIRRLKYDLSVCYKIIHNEIAILSDAFLVFSDFTRTRGHCYKLVKGCSRVNAYKYFFLNRITEIWNALPSAVVKASSCNVFHADVGLCRLCYGWLFPPFPQWAISAFHFS